MSHQSYQEIEFTSVYSCAKKVEDKITVLAEQHGFTEEDIFALRLSLEEAFSNAIRHGNKGQKDKKVSVRYFINDERIDIYISDEGDGFDPNKVPDPTTETNLENPNGRGIMLMRAYMNLVEYNDRGNVVHLVKLKPGTTAPKSEKPEKPANNNP